MLMDMHLQTKYENKKGTQNVGEIANTMAKELTQILHSGDFIIAVLFDGDRQPDCKTTSLFKKKQRALNNHQQALRLYQSFRVECFS